MSLPGISLPDGCRLAFCYFTNWPVGSISIRYLEGPPVTSFPTFLTISKGLSRHLSTFEEYCFDDAVLPQVFSKTYNQLITPPDDYQLSCLLKWETDLDCTFTPDRRNNIIRVSLKSSICTWDSGNQFQTSDAMVSYTISVFSPTLPIIPGDARRSGGHYYM